MSNIKTLTRTLVGAFSLMLIVLLPTQVLAEHSHPLFKDNTSYKRQLMWPELTVPWGMAQLPDGRILATERSGTLFLLTEGKPAIEVTNLPDIHQNNQGGLLDVALHPDFGNNSIIYFTYASKAGGGFGSNTALMQAKLALADIGKNTNKPQATLTHKKMLYKGEGNSYSGSHYGSRIVISKGHIYFSIGDRGDRDENPQSLSRDGGKIYRLNLDGSIPKSNPFYKHSNAKKAIYSLGHRNPQGLIKLGNTGQVWSHEHGPKGGDEVNLIEAGKNYGWPVVSYGVNYSGSKITHYTEKAGTEQPKLYWVPSIAPSGMAHINSPKYPQWQGKVLLGSMKYRHLVLLEISDKKVVKQTKLLSDIGGRVRSVMQGVDGYIYVGVDGQGIYRLLP